MLIERRLFSARKKREEDESVLIVWANGRVSCSRVCPELTEVMNWSCGRGLNLGYGGGLGFGEYC